MAFVEDKFISSGVYHIINSGQHRSIIHSGDNGKRLTASSNDGCMVSDLLLISNAYVVTPSSDLVVNHFAGR